MDTSFPMPLPMRASRHLTLARLQTTVSFLALTAEDIPLTTRFIPGQLQPSTVQVDRTIVLGQHT
jgi:hypothetical protein